MLLPKVSLTNRNWRGKEQRFVFILLYWLICIHSYFHWFLHSICWNLVLKAFSLGLHNCVKLHMPWSFTHLWTLEKLHKKPLWKAVLNLEKIFFVSYIRHIWICGQKKVFSEASPFQEMCQKSEIHKNRILPTVVIAHLILVLCVPKQARTQCHHPSVMEKKMWSFLTTLLVHSFWINVQVPWTVTLTMYSVFFQRKDTIAVVLGVGGLRQLCFWSYCPGNHKSECCN